MREWTDKHPHWLIPLAMAMLAVAATGESWPDPGAKPVTAPILLFEMLEVLLLVGITGACALLIVRVRVWQSATAAAAMTAALLAGEIYSGVKPATPPMLLVELLEAALLVSGSIACAFLLRRRC